MLRQNMVRIRVIFILLQCCAIALIGSEECPNVKTSLKAIRKRHLAFPDKSTVVITISLSKNFQTHVPSGWAMISDMDLHYPLPNDKFMTTQFSRKLHHRQKRELWKRISSAFDLLNMNGQECVLRSICEAKKLLAPKGKSLVHDLLRAIFTAPLQEKDFEEESSGLHNALQDPNYCVTMPDCPVSLIHFLLAFNKR